MGYGRKPRRYPNRDYRKGRAKPKLAVAGAGTLAFGVLIIFYGKELFDFNTWLLIGFVTIPAGMILLIKSMSKKNQRRFDRGLDRVAEAIKDDCQCCKCQNCGQNHNHWTHD